MKAFHFRLQTKLDITIRQEQLAREELQLRIIERDQIQSELDRALDGLERLEQSIRNFDLKKHNFQELLILKDYVPVIKKLIKELETKLAQAEQKLEEARKILLERIRETRTLEKLKEKEWEAYLHELSLEEQKVIDEIAINNHYRKNIS
ncbi:MAG: flagellar export protein FliJ [Syntrophomonas sp.]